ncbi:hypothetical protein HPP92_007694 [Vanilla planifolia]|uniref:Uncharacterized protein n=1 Tax=Vanilla planifolia TaxID=51239 RepID=A0A835RMG1_VANPL|nr:hypothetical protein HPP92_007694 [Vanilla planifolia]
MLPGANVVQSVLPDGPILISRHLIDSTAPHSLPSRLMYAKNSLPASTLLKFLARKKLKLWAPRLEIGDDGAGEVGMKDQGALAAVYLPLAERASSKLAAPVSHLQSTGLLSLLPLPSPSSTLLTPPLFPIRPPFFVNSRFVLCSTNLSLHFVAQRLCQEMQEIALRHELFPGFALLRLWEEAPGNVSGGCAGCWRELGSCARERLRRRLPVLMQEPGNMLEVRQRRRERLTRDLVDALSIPT